MKRDAVRILFFVLKHRKLADVLKYAVAFEKSV
jgi:hypothetical protein